jgi:MFS family permease
MYSLAYALFTEFFPKDKNGILIGIFNAIYPLAGILLCFFFMVSYSWRLLYLITSLIHIYYVYITLKYFLESPRWLHSVGNKEKCLETLTQLAIFNGREKQWIEFQNQNKDLINKVGTPFLEGNENNNNNMNKTELKTNYNIIQILRFKSQRNIFIKVTIISTCSMYNYYGIVLNLAKMDGNFYLNSIFAFLGELISELITGELADKYGIPFYEASAKTGKNVDEIFYNTAAEIARKIEENFYDFEEDCGIKQGPNRTNKENIKNSQTTGGGVQLNGGKTEKKKKCC